MTGTVLALPVALPLLASGLAMAATRHPLLRRALTLGVSAAVLALGVALLVHTSDGSVLSHQLGGWLPGVAIVFAADTLGALMLTATALLVVVCLAFAAAAGDDRHPLFGSLALILSAGVYGALLTADLFNLFVLIEVMLVPSYVLLTLTGGRQRVAAGRIYLTYNLLASTVFLGGLAMLYGVTGTVNLGELAGAAQDSPRVALAGAVILLAMAAKASVVPLHGWLPRTYPFATPAVTALFSGLLTKVGLYVIIRVYAVVYEGEGAYLWLLLAAAWLTMVVGVLGAVGQQAMREILTFHMVSQVGYILLGLALFSAAGLTAAIFYLVQYVLVKAALLLCSGAVETAYGTDRLDRLGGLAGREPLLTVAFIVAALSLAGLPPLSGFVAKLSLIRAAVLEADIVSVTIAVSVSLLTLLSMIKIWSGVFAGRLSVPAREAWTPAAAEGAPGSAGAAGAFGTAGSFGPPEDPRTRVALVLPAVVLAAFSLWLGVGAQPLLELAETAAEGLLDTSAWVEAVMTP
ncbi:Na+/H+ antiporter subunit D [Streptomyces sodiiphilus]|uniref:Na+/H+ antiporter subunit D n=1 Tax=Streptomyces sodiiphilus TaxID=226217 RepID=A0ABN2NUB6_9ACTN